MCFSANASFGSSAILLVSGIAATRTAAKSSQLAFASIPFIFAVQQLCEGFLWLSFNDSTLLPYRSAATHAFLVFAQVIWPVWVPLAFLLLESERQRKMILTAFLLLGILISTYLAYCLVNYPVGVRVSSHHIYYELTFPYARTKLIGILYFIPTVLSPFAVRIRQVWIIATLNLVSYMIAKNYFQDTLISVWCFFAAAISIMIFYILKKTNDTSKDPSTSASAQA